MPNAVLVALASASLTAASGAALTHIRSHRNPSAARLHGTSPLGKKRTHRHHGHRHGRTRASASPEIEALRVKPGWHPEGSPETRVKQLGYDLEGRCAPNPAGVFYPVVLVGDLAARDVKRARRGVRGYVRGGVHALHAQVVRLASHRVGRPDQIRLLIQDVLHL